MEELVCLLLHYVILWQQSYANAVECFGQIGLHGKWMNPPKKFKLQNHGYTLFLLEMDESEKVLWFKRNLKALEDVKAVVLHKHANHTGDLRVLVKLIKEWSMLCAGKMTTEKKL